MINWYETINTSNQYVLCRSSLPSLVASSFVTRFRRSTWRFLPPAMQFHATSSMFFNEQHCCSADEAKYGGREFIWIPPPSYEPCLSVLGSTSRRVFGLASHTATSPAGPLTAGGCSPARPQPSSDPQHLFERSAGLLSDDSSPAPPDQLCTLFTTVRASAKLRVNCGSRRHSPAKHNDTTFDEGLESLFERLVVRKETWKPGLEAFGTVLSIPSFRARYEHGHATCFNPELWVWHLLWVPSTLWLQCAPAAVHTTATTIPTHRQWSLPDGLHTRTSGFGLADELWHHLSRRLYSWWPDSGSSDAFFKLWSSRWRRPDRRVLPGLGAY